MSPYILLFHFFHFFFSCVLNGVTFILNKERKMMQESYYNNTPQMANLNLVVDGLTLALSPRQYKQSEFFSELMEDASSNISLPLDVDKPSFLKIVAFFKHHSTNPFSKIEKPMKSDFSELVKDPWDAQFVRNEMGSSLVALIMTANYLNIPSLLNLLLAKTASLMTTNDLCEIKKRFNLDQEVDETEACEINPWVFIPHNF